METRDFSGWKREALVKELARLRERRDRAVLSRKVREMEDEEIGMIIEEMRRRT
jgi:predicted CopG family antitoxin